MARRGGSSKRGGTKVLQIATWIIAVLVVVSMVLSVLPFAQ